MSASATWRQRRENKSECVNRSHQFPPKKKKDDFFFLSADIFSFQDFIFDPQ